MQDHFDLSELISATTAETGLESSQVDATVKAALKILKAEISEHGYVALNGFGSFKTRVLAPENGTDPHGNEYSVPARITVDFNPAKAFRDELTAVTGTPAIP